LELGIIIEFKFIKKFLQAAVIISSFAYYAPLC